MAGLPADFPAMSNVAVERLTVKDYRAMPAGPPYYQYDFSVDALKPVRVVDHDETFQTALLPGLVISAADVFKR